jgi:tRNA modification GTPase
MIRHSGFFGFNRSAEYPYIRGMLRNDTICALSTAPGMGAIGLIRMSGEESLSIMNSIFSRSIDHKTPANSALFGRIMDGDEIVDEVVVTVFKNPHSYTGEDVVEIACHGSVYIQNRILQLLLDKGTRMADPGEYTMRAFVNGKMDLSQAEAVADLIASESAGAHRVAMNQMRGGFSNEIAQLREKLIEFASLIELELDFGEEDVEFANREQLFALIEKVLNVIRDLIQSFSLGNALKNGIPVALVGPPNAGKSTLLNALLNEDRAIVSDIAGTTRDTIEDVVNINGVKYRFIDTAGIRETTDQIETLGIQRSLEKVEKADIVIYLIDPTQWNEQTQNGFDQVCQKAGKKLIPVINKTDLDNILDNLPSALRISAKAKNGLDELIETLSKKAGTERLNDNSTVVTNIRHYESLIRAEESLIRAEEGLHSGISGDLLAMDIRDAMKHLGNITGEIDVDKDILGAIFGKFCIGK